MDFCFRLAKSPERYHPKLPWEDRVLITTETFPVGRGALIHLIRFPIFGLVIEKQEPVAINPKREIAVRNIISVVNSPHGETEYAEPSRPPLGIIGHRITPLSNIQTMGSCDAKKTDVNDKILHNAVIQETAEWRYY